MRFLEYEIIGSKNKIRGFENRGTWVRVVTFLSDQEPLNKLNSCDPVKAFEQFLTIRK